jgi:hypothetical protein
MHYSYLPATYLRSSTYAPRHRRISTRRPCRTRVPRTEEEEEFGHLDGDKHAVGEVCRIRAMDARMLGYG